VSCVGVCRPAVLKHHQYQLNLMKCRLSVLMWILFMGDCTVMMQGLLTFWKFLQPPSSRQSQSSRDTKDFWNVSVHAQLHSIISQKEGGWSIDHRTWNLYAHKLWFWICSDWQTREMFAFCMPFWPIWSILTNGTSYRTWLQSQKVKCIEGRCMESSIISFICG